jgi:spore maturation protein CgeB
VNILIVYYWDPRWIGASCQKALSQAHHVEHFDLRQTPGYTTRLGKSLCIGRRTDVSKVISQCSREPDLAIEIDGYGSFHLAGYRSLGIPTAYWAIDSHINLDFQRNIASDFDCVFVAQKDYTDSFRQVADHVSWLPLAVDPETHRRFTVDKQFDIGYVGSFYDPERLAEHSKLAAFWFSQTAFKERMRLLKHLSAKYNLVVSNNAWGENQAKVYNLCKIGFNHSIGGDLNLRVFEVMSSGTMLLTDRIGNGLTELFEDREHLVTYTAGDLDDLVDYYLVNESDREKIADQGQQIVRKKHTYEVRMKQMLAELTRGRTF